MTTDIETEEHPVNDTEARIASAPLPTARTLRRRNALAMQAWRFAVINLRMVRMIRRSHTPPAQPTADDPR
jgi:hypothetical protein